MTPSVHCPKCGSGNLARGRVLEHFVCKYVGIEDDFLVEGKYICPRCKVELRTIGNDYQSLGLLRKCYNCSEIFSTTALRWRCLKCSSLASEDRVTEVNIYSYHLDDTKRSWLEFELKPKIQLIEFLKQRGYAVVENATMTGRSGAQYSIDILASRDDGIINHNVAIGVEVSGGEIGLERIQAFDEKAYDIGIHNKILIVLPGLSKEAKKFASQQRITALEVTDLEPLMLDLPQPSNEVKKEDFRFESKSQLLNFLRQRDYQVSEEADVKGRSGAMHKIDILATRDDGIITYNIGIGIEVSEAPVELDKVFDFDDKAYDTGIQDKALIAVPGLTREAKQFAQRQRIMVLEAGQL